MRHWAAIVPLLGLAGCVPTPPFYSAPAQHKPIAGEEVLGFGEYVESAHHSAESFFIKDVKALEGSAWRWTHAEPEFRFFLKSAQRRVFRLDMAISDVTFRDTGPVRMAVRINGQLLDEPLFDKPGNHLYEKAVPASLLKENAENRVVVEVKNPWNAPDPGVRLGFLLHGVGFVSR